MQIAFYKRKYSYVVNTTIITGFSIHYFTIDVSVSIKIINLEYSWHDKRFIGAQFISLRKKTRTHVSKIVEGKNLNQYLFNCSTLHRICIDRLFDKKMNLKLSHLSVSLENSLICNNFIESVKHSGFFFQKKIEDLMQKI
jgi:hypothetical protein